MAKKFWSWPQFSPLRLWRLVLRVWRGFLDNKGLLLAGAVAYNTLLSIIPLFALFLMILSYFFDKAVLLKTVKANLNLITPGQASAITQQIALFFDNRELLQGIGFLVLLFFSSLAFSILEGALNQIIPCDDERPKRPFWLSFVIPYLYIFTLGIALLLLTVIRTILEYFSGVSIELLVVELSLSSLPGTVLYILSLLGLILLLASLYKVMPRKKIQMRYALVGGLVAALFWEVTRHILVWYFSTISLVNLVYGSLAAVIIVLLSFEVAAVIILLGAQVIAELEAPTPLPSPTNLPPPTNETTKIAPPPTKAQQTSPPPKGHADGNGPEHLPRQTRDKETEQTRDKETEQSEENKQTSARRQREASPCLQESKGKDKREPHTEQPREIE